MTNNAPIRPLLTADEIDRIVRGFGERYKLMWDAVRVVAQQLGAEHDDEGRRRWLWHQLLLETGNFKHQAPILAPPITQSPLKEEDVRTPIKVWSFASTDVQSRTYAEVPLCLSSRDPESWLKLISTTGIQAATASTILAALWPSSHVIIDRLAFPVAIALSGLRHGWPVIGVGPLGGAWPENVAEDSRVTYPVNLKFYPWYRAAVVNTAIDQQRQPVEVERCLYLIGAERAKKARTQRALSKATEAGLNVIGEGPEPRDVEKPTSEIWSVWAANVDEAVQSLSKALESRQAP